MPFRFNGDVPLLYPQYRDLDADLPLQAVPGGVYDMAPVGGLNVPVPPGDGRWEDTDPPPPPPPPDDPPAGDPPGPPGDTEGGTADGEPLITGSTEGEE